MTNIFNPFYVFKLHINFLPVLPTEISKQNLFKYMAENNLGVKELKKKDCCQKIMDFTIS